MSAYICDKNVFVYLVTAAQSPRMNYSGGTFRWYWKDVSKPGQMASDELACNDYEKAAEVANMLRLENICSVSARYPGDKTSATLPGPTVSEDITEKDFGCWSRPDYLSPDPVQVLKTINCLRYQSCEHDAWEASQAYAFLMALEHSSIARLPGYEDAEWGAPEKKESNCISLSSLSRRRKL